MQINGEFDSKLKNGGGAYRIRTDDPYTASVVL